MESNSEQAPCSPAPLTVGCKVLIKGIVSRPELNACIGKVIGSFDSEKQAWPVRVVLEKGDID